MTANAIVIRRLGLQDYCAAWRAMQQFTNERSTETSDEIWVLQHPSVFTQGQNGKPEHILSPGDIPIIQVDRGGQVTYHGPGQLVIYTLIDLKRKKLNVREIVTILENAVIRLLTDFQLPAYSECKAPGVYIDQKKICSVGLRVRRGCTFHGLAFNLDMDLEPFTRINPCGFAQLKMAQLSDFMEVNFTQIELKLVEYLIQNLGYTSTCHASAVGWISAARRVIHQMVDYAPGGANPPYNS